MVQYYGEAFVPDDVIAAKDKLPPPVYYVKKAIEEAKEKGNE